MSGKAAMAVLLRLFLRAAQPLLESTQSWLSSGALHTESASQEFFICCGALPLSCRATATRLILICRLLQHQSSCGTPTCCTGSLLNSLDADDLRMQGCWPGHQAVFVSVTWSVAGHADPGVDVSAPSFWHDAFWLRTGASGELLCPDFLSAAAPGIVAAGKAALLLRAYSDYAPGEAPGHSVAEAPAADLCSFISRQLQRLVRGSC